MLNFNFSDVVHGVTPAVVIDVGAMLPQGQTAFCIKLVERGLARLVCFEPNEKECEQLGREIAGRATVLPYFIGDGSDRTYFETNLAMTGSLYEPNSELVDLYHHLGNIMKITARHSVKTVRLDDIREIGDADLLKMDVQGAELDVVRGAPNVLEGVTIVQTEVSFIELYKGQCLFADIDRALRNIGFQFHTFRGG